jgi:hypothetical protein
MDLIYIGDDGTRWLSLGAAAKFLGVSDETISRRATLWRNEPVSGKLRWKYLKLGEDTRKERRYVLDDLEAMLVTA